MLDVQTLVGGKEVDYVSKNTYLVVYEDKDLDRIRQMEAVAYVDIYRSEFKISPDLRETTTSSSNQIEVDILFHSDTDTKSKTLQAQIAEKSGLDLEAISFFYDKARLTLPGSCLQEMAKIDEVRLIEEVGKIALW